MLSFDKQQRYHELLIQKFASFIWFIKAFMISEWYRATCANGLEEPGTHKVKILLVPFLKYGRKIHAKEQHFFET